MILITSQPHGYTFVKRSYDKRKSPTLLQLINVIVVHFLESLYIQESNFCSKNVFEKGTYLLFD